ncbi:Ppx/GppA phosphatase family protein [Smaragdicoccus niigatensis]|uniref:Ppx/GppA phosphatase family protein n=1 Tax=Smaragdicoccus niigatensis TaxID=359359 RepID=UPI0003A97641|nr:Ppx/GppA phosphatase family protein [Smaragdicoccus niigatensis]
MRLGVLDVGSNTVHLLVVDAHRGAHPTPMSSTKHALKLSENMDEKGKITKAGSDLLTSLVSDFSEIAKSSGCGDLMAFATSAIREAGNGDEVLKRVKDEAGVALQVLTGQDEARLTFLAVRRWFGWSAGRIMNFDIGGGSLEMSVGGDEEPDVALSVPLGAGRVTRQWLTEDPPDKRRISMLRDWLDAELADSVELLREVGSADLTVGTSKTFRSLARLTGAAPSSAGPRTKRYLTRAGLRQVIAFITRMTTSDRAELEGVSSDRAKQLVAGALVAEATMRALSVDQLEICPWALREGLILRRLDAEVEGTPLVAAP